MHSEGILGKRLETSKETIMAVEDIVKFLSSEQSSVEFFNWIWVFEISDFKDGDIKPVREAVARGTTEWNNWSDGKV